MTTDAPRSNRTAHCDGARTRRVPSSRARRRVGVGVAVALAAALLAACSSSGGSDTTTAAATTAATTAATAAATTATTPASTADTTAPSAAATTAGADSTAVGGTAAGAAPATAVSAADTTAAGASGTSAAAGASTTEAAATSTIAGTPAPAGGTTITLVAYDSFVLSKDVLAMFTRTTGIGLKILTNGDTGELVNKAILTKDAPLGDVLWGIDNTFLDRALTAKIFTPYKASTYADIDPQLTALVPGNEVTPVDYGDVCINYDKAALTKANLKPPTSLEDLADPKYKGALVVENPSTSSPGLAFLLATIAHFGTDKWQAYWQKLKANGVLVVNGWTEAYDTWFAGGDGKGNRSLVVSYGSSPPAAVLYGPDPKATVAPIGVVLSTCFREDEFAGVLAGTKHEAEAQKLVDFLSGPTVQEDMQLNMFVFPANRKAPLVAAFADFAARPASWLAMDPKVIEANRDAWIDAWTKAVLSTTKRSDTAEAPTSRLPHVGLLAAVPVAVLGLLYVWPVLHVAGRGLDLSVGREVVTDGRLRSIAWFTVWQATLSTALVLAVAVPLAGVFARFDFAGRRALQALLVAPFTLPTVVVGAAFLALLPPAHRQGALPVVAAHVFFNVGFVARSVSTAWEGIDPRFAEAARTLGAPPLRAWRTVVLPRLTTSMAASASLVFTLCFTSFGVVLLLGGARRETIDVEIYRQAFQLLRLDRAAVLAILQIIAISALTLSPWVRSGRSTAQRQRARQHRRPLRAARAAWAIRVALALATTALLLPIGVLVERAFREANGGWGTANFRALGSTMPGSGLVTAPIASVAVSLRIAALATLIAVSVGIMTSVVIARWRGRRARALDVAVLLPLSTSAVVLGLGFLLGFARSPIAWRSQWFAVPLVQSVVCLPFVVRTALPALRSIDPRLRDAAAALGASPWRTWWTIDAPLARRALLGCSCPRGRRRAWGVRGDRLPRPAPERDPPGCDRPSERATWRRPARASGRPRRGARRAYDPVDVALGRVRNCRGGQRSRRRVMSNSVRDESETAPSAAPTGLDVRDIVVRFGARVVLDRVTLRVDRGEIVCVTGPSGCGKSTLLRTIAGLQVPDAGTVVWDGRDITAEPAHRRGFGYVFQDLALFPHLDVAANIAYGLRMRGWDRRRREVRVDEMLQLVDLAGSGRRSTATLSGGEQQRVALARAIAPSPHLLLLDEPFAALDRALRHRLAREVREIVTSLGLTAVHVTHDLEEAAVIGHRSLALSPSAGPATPG